MDDAAKAAKRKEIEEKVAAMKLEQKKLEVGVCGGRLVMCCFSRVSGKVGGHLFHERKNFPPLSKEDAPSVPARIASN